MSLLCRSSIAVFSVGVVFHFVFVLKVLQNKGELEVNTCFVFSDVCRNEKLTCASIIIMTIKDTHLHVYSTNLNLINVYKEFCTKCYYTSFSG